jgi:hypothetical protein
MLFVSSSDTIEAADPSANLVMKEIQRLGAPADEVRAAFAFVAKAAIDPRAYDALSPRMRRLVDLAGVADVPLSTVLGTAIKLHGDAA